MTDFAIKAANLSKRYTITQSEPGEASGFAASLRNKLFGNPACEFWALQDISFSVEPGQVIGIIGNNGAGKSTLLKILSRITEPTAGSLRIRGRVGSLLEVGTGFHPELTGRENIYLNGVIMGMKKAEVRQKFAEIVAFAGVDAFLDTPVKRYSSGMYMRLAFSVAAHLDPDVLIIDEVLAVGDAAFQKKCLGKLRDVASNSKRTVLFVSHNFQAVQAICEKTMHLEHGRIVAFGNTQEVVARYLETTSTEASVSRSWEQDAPGNADIRLKQLEIISNGKSNGIYSSSQDIAVNFMFSTARESQQLRVGFEMAGSTGIPIFSTWRSDTYNRPYRTQAGINRWRCIVPGGLLNAGTYSIIPKLGFEPDEWIVDGVDAAVTFEIVLDHGVSPYWNSLDASSRPGLIAPILDWRSAPEHQESEAGRLLEYSR